MTVHYDEPIETETAADADLILRTRSGDGTAFGELWRRHYPSGMAVARSITSSIDADDLVQESYARIYQAILKGGGPNGSFRAYLFTSIRNTAAAWGRARRELAMDELETIPDPDSTEQASNEALDRGLTAQAFRSLPTRWQEVLWYTEIEQMKPAHVAPLLGMKPGGVSQLAFRAREGLREAWIQAHLQSTASDSDCHWAIEHLGAYSRGNLSGRDRKRIDQHLEDCARCLIVAGEAKEVSSRLALVMLPLVLGVAGAGGYTAMLQSGAAPVVALAAMPSSVIAGGVVAGGGVAPMGVDGAVGATSAGSTGGGASGGAITGIGALVGVGSAALVVAGVVVAATIVPGLLDANPVASLPNAGDADGSSISSDVSPDGDIEPDDKLVLEVPDAPKKDAPDTPPEKKPVAPPVEETPQASTPPGDGTGNDYTEPTDPTEPPVDPGDDGDDGETDPGDGGGETDPGDGGGETDPGDGGGETDPGDGDGETDPTDPTLPEGKPTIGATTVDLNLSNWKTSYTVTVTGVADATVRAVIGDDPTTTRETTLTAPEASALSPMGESGSGAVVLMPTLDQLCDDVNVDFSYVLGDEVGEVESKSLSDLGEFPYPWALKVACKFNVSLQTAMSSQASLVPAPSPEQPAEPVVEEPITEEPVVEEPAVEEPITEEPVVEEPVTEEPAETTPATTPATLRTDELLPAEEPVPAE